MKKEFTKEMLDKIVKANESVRGTSNYYFYHMSCCFKSSTSGKWVFLGNYIPYQTGHFKKYRDNLYIITENGDRYELTERVRELIGV